MTARTRPILAVALAMLCATGLLSACGGGSKKQIASTTAPSTASTSASPTHPATPTARPTPKPVLRNALTGLGTPSPNPVIAVKIDDTEPGRPQVGIDKADVVYIEQAEGGLSRLVGIFSTVLPTVGYVRSTRPSDPDLLLQYGKITLAASGGGGDALPLLDASGLKPWINDRSAPYYSRVSRQSDYINLILDLAAVARATKTVKARSIGWTFSAGYAPLGGLPAGTDVRTAVGSTPVEFKWDATLKKYVRYIDGVRQFAGDGAPMSATNVVVQECQIVPHPADTDVNGNPSQFTFTVGTGRVWVFRNGRTVVGTWKRTSINSGTVLVDAKGAVIPLTPGNTWVALKGRGIPVTGS